MRNNIIGKYLAAAGWSLVNTLPRKFWGLKRIIVATANPTRLDILDWLVE